MKKSLAAGAVALALMAGVGGCSSPTGPEVASGGAATVTLWQFNTDETTVAAWQKAVADFETANPDIKVDMQTVPWSEQAQKLTTGLATGAMPDVSMLGNDVVAQYQAQGALLPLDEYMKQWSQDEGVADVSKDYWPGDELYYKLDGHWYASPVAEETRLLYYRTDLFKQAGLDPSNPPKTWAEVAAAAQKLKAVTDIPFALPMSKDYQTVQDFMSVYLGYGAKMLDNGKCGFDTQEFRTALTWYTDIYKNGLDSVDAVTKSGDDLAGMFKNGQAGMYMNNSSTLSQMKQQGSEFADKVMATEVPSGPAGQFGFLGGWPLVLWKQSKNPDAAAKLIHYLTSPKGALKDLNTVGGMLPGRRSLAKGSPWNEGTFVTEVKQLEKAYPYQYPDAEIPQMGTIEVETVQDAVTRVATGEMTVDQSTKQLCSDLNAALGK
jgi:ABC-type glycerol-3-phosphate transport system substrate-binding protein